MDHHSSKLFRIIKIVLAVAAAVNLVLLFGFQYELPFLPHEDETSAADNISEITSNKLSDAEETETTAEGWSFVINPETITYDGEGDLDIMQGVDLKDAKGKSSDNEVVTQIYTGNTLSDKVIEYTANADDGQVVGQRTLTLKNYNGPSIELPETLPELEEKSSDAMLEALIGDDSLKVLDGYGNDLSDKLKVSFSREAGDGGHTLCTFTVSNTFGDTATKTAYLTGTAEEPELGLTDTTASVKTGSAFDPLSYVEYAVDVDGTDLADTVKTEGTVDTATPGDYTVTYTCTGQDGTVSEAKELTVIVK